MRDGLRYALLVVAGLLGVLLVVALTAWGLTTYGSIRHVVGDIAALPDKTVALDGQYNAMVTAFATGSETFTFRFNAAPVEVGKSQVAGLDRDGVIGLVLDRYTSDLYDGQLISGSPGPAGAVFGATGNLLYLVATLVLAIVFGAFVAGGVLPFPEVPMPDRLKAAGAVIAIACVLAFVIFAFLPGVARSIAWGYIGNHDAARDILDILQPALVGSLLRNTLLMGIFGGLVCGAGFFLEMQDAGPGRQKPVRAPDRYESRPEVRPPRANNHKRRSL